MGQFFESYSGKRAQFFVSYLKKKKVQFCESFFFFQKKKVQFFESYSKKKVFNSLSRIEKCSILWVVLKSVQFFESY